MASVPIWATMSRSSQEEKEEGPSLPPRTFRPNSQITRLGSQSEIMPAVGLVMLYELILGVCVFSVEYSQ